MTRKTIEAAARFRMGGQRFGRHLADSRWGSAWIIQDGKGPGSKDEDRP